MHAASPRCRAGRCVTFAASLPAAAGWKELWQPRPMPRYAVSWTPRPPSASPHSGNRARSEHLQHDWNRSRYCRCEERCNPVLDCFVAALLAMTRCVSSHSRDRMPPGRICHKSPHTSDTRMAAIFVARVPILPHIPNGSSSPAGLPGRAGAPQRHTPRRARSRWARVAVCNECTRRLTSSPG